MGIGWTEILLILAVLLLLFGATRLPALMGGLGKGIREFKKSVREEEDLSEDGLAAQLRRDIGKRVLLNSDGVLLVGGSEGAVLKEVESGWATVEDGTTVAKLSLASVKKVVHRS